MNVQLGLTHRALKNSGDFPPEHEDRLNVFGQGSRILFPFSGQSFKKTCFPFRLSHRPVNAGHKPLIIDFADTIYHLIYRLELRKIEKMDR